MIYSASADGYVVKWQLDKSDGELVLKGDEAFYSVSFDPLSGSLFAGTRSGLMFEVDRKSLQLKKREQRHAGGIFFIKTFLDEVFTGGGDGRLVTNQGEMHLSALSLRCCSVLGRDLYIGSSDGMIYGLNTSTMESTLRLKGHDKSVFGLEMIDKNTLVSIGRDATIRQWDLEERIEVRKVPAHEYQGKSISYNGQHLLTSSMDKTIKIWDQQLNLLKVMDYARNQSHINCINRVKWMKDNIFVSCSDDRTIMVWQIEFNT